MKKTLAEIANIVNGEVIGDKDVIITGLSSIQEAKEGDLTFVSNPKYIPLIKQTKASALIVPRDISIPEKSVILADNPSLAFTKLMSELAGENACLIKGIHPTAVVDKTAKLGKNVAVGACAVIEKDVTIGEGTIIHAGSYIGPSTKIGRNCLIYPHVTIREKNEIGNSVIIHSGTVVGSDGFGYIQIDGKHVKIPQVGIVVIEDDVEIGANVTIDRARFDKTVIGRGTKIDNLVQIAHNVIIGEDCIIIAQVGISGSTKIGKGAILAGQAGTAGHLTIGEGVIVAARSGVTKSIEPNQMVSGFPAKPHMQERRVNACVQRLPHYVKIIQDLQKKIEELEKKTKS